MIDAIWECLAPHAGRARASADRALPRWNATEPSREGVPPPGSVGKRPAADIREEAARLQDPLGGAPPPRKVFLSEYEIKKALTPGAQQLTIPKEAILSPLAVEWMELKGIRVIRT